LKIVEDAFDEAYEILYSEEGWKEEKKNDKGDIICSKKSKKGKRIWRVVAKIDCEAEKLSNKMKDTSDICEWNTTLTKHEILKNITGQVNVSYQVTSSGGPVSARDFLLGTKIAEKGGAFLQAGQSVDIAEAPKPGSLVRAWNGPGGTAIKPLPGGKCEFRWLMDCDYKGWIPSSIMDVAMPFAQTQFVDSVRKLAATL